MPRTALAKASLSIHSAMVEPPHFAAQFGEARHQRVVALGIADLHDQGAVEFHEINLEGMQVIDRRGAGAESSSPTR
jgi:hypothetical protein